MTCPVTLGVLWWLVASTFLWLTWNKVITQFAKLKQAKFWQAALLIFTLCVLFCLPKAYMRHHKCCHGGGGGGDDKSCPFHGEHH
jgi:MFS superfamily sulfate permease-like transporter